MSRLGTTLAMSSAWHPAADEQTERANAVLEQYLRHYVSATHDDWDEFLASAEFAVNNQYQESIENTPLMLNFGQHPRSPLSLTVPRAYKVPAVQHWHGRMQETLKVAKAALQAAQNRQKAYADTHRRDLSFEAGDFVLLNSKID